MQRHPAKGAIQAYALGELPAGAAMVVEAHLTFCRRCAHEVDQLETAAGALLEAAPPVDLGQEALDRALKLLGQTPAASAQAPGRTPRCWRTLPEPFRRLTVDRRRWLAPGVWIEPLEPWRASSGSRTYLLRAPPGATLPEHSHEGSEFICVLAGAFADQSGRYVQGDFVAAPEDLTHQPKVTSDEVCVCLVYTEHPLRMHGLLGRAIQALVGV